MISRDFNANYHLVVDSGNAFNMQMLIAEVGLNNPPYVGNFSGYSNYKANWTCLTNNEIASESFQLTESINPDGKYEFGGIVTAEIRMRVKAGTIHEDSNSSYFFVCQYPTTDMDERFYVYSDASGKCVKDKNDQTIRTDDISILTIGVFAISSREISPDGMYEDIIMLDPFSRLNCQNTAISLVGWHGTTFNAYLKEMCKELKSGMVFTDSSSLAWSDYSVRTTDYDEFVEAGEIPPINFKHSLKYDSLMVEEKVKQMCQMSGLLFSIDADIGRYNSGVQHAISPRIFCWGHGTKSIDDKYRQKSLKIKTNEKCYFFPSVGNMDASVPSAYQPYAKVVNISSLMESIGLTDADRTYIVENMHSWDTYPLTVEARGDATFLVGNSVRIIDLQGNTIMCYVAKRTLTGIHNMVDRYEMNTEVQDSTYEYIGNDSDNTLTGNEWKIVGEESASDLSNVAGISVKKVMNKANEFYAVVTFPSASTWQTKIEFVIKNPQNYGVEGTSNAFMKGYYYSSTYYATIAVEYLTTGSNPRIRLRPGFSKVENNGATGTYTLTVYWR